MELQGTIGEGELTALRGVLSRRQQRAAWAWWGLCMGLLAFSALVDRVEPAPLRWLPGLCGLGLFWFSYFRPRRQRDEGLQRLGRLKRIKLDSATLECESEASQSRFQLSLVREVDRSPGLVVLILEGNTYVPLFRSWAADEPAWQAVLAHFPQVSA